jgi:hypothetical protein
VQITFEIRAGTSDWRLAVINTKQTVKGDYSLIYDGKHDKKDISQIQNYLAEDNISGLTAYIDGHGESARAIAQYLRGEIQIKSSDAVKLNP